MTTDTPQAGKPADAATSRFFDFADASLRAIEQFAHLRRDTIFVNTEKPEQKFGGWKAKLAAFLTAHAIQRRARTLQAQTEDSSYAFQKERPLGLRNLIYKPDDAFVESLALSVPRAQAQSYAFHHELGHLVVKDAHGPMPKGKPYPENAADGFATLVHLQENKHDVLLPLVNSWARAYRFVASGVPVHMTSTSIEAIVADSLQGKTPAESNLAKQAESYAEAQAPDDETIDNARYIYGRFRGRGELFPIGEDTQKKLMRFAETALASEDRFAFQVGLTVFRPLLHPAGVEINGVAIRLDDETRRDMTEKFESRAAAFGIQSLIAAWRDNVDSMLAGQQPASGTPAPATKPLKLSIS